jgi:ferritin-like protein
MKNTFGSTKAAETLETLVEKYPAARRRISTLLSQYTERLMKMTLMKDPSTVKLCMSLLRDFTIERIDKKQTLSKEMKTYAKNVVTGRYREYLSVYNEVVKMMDSKKK